MRERINIKGVTLSSLLKCYLDGDIWVNRCYQRKLVWKLEDKQRFIQSLFEGIPIPAVIYAEKMDNNRTTYEIIDGLQRTNAIVSFLMGEYPVKIGGEEGYFNPEGCNVTHNYKNKEEQNYPENNCLLSYDISYQFSECEIPRIVIPNDQVQIEKIFNRINSTGKKLSPQDIRQATSYNKFSEIVRELASSFRGDYTYSNIINLCDIQKISFGYGLKIEDSFWIKNRIFESYRLWDSKDEEIIAQSVIAILMDNYDASVDVLNSAYDEQSKNGKNLINLINKRGNGNEFLEDLCYVGGILRKIYESGNIAIDDKYFTKNEKRMRVLYVALFKVYEEGIDINSFVSNTKLIGNLINSFDVSDNTLDSWNTQISSIYNLLISRGHKLSEKMDSITLDVALRLQESAYESQMTEYKIGFTKIGCTRPFISSDNTPNNTIDRIAKTLTAMCNTESNMQNGCVIVGIADNQEQADNWKHCYKAEYIRYGSHSIVGVQEEIKKCFDSSDAFLKYFVDELEKCSIDEELKRFVEQNLKIITFESKQLLVIPTKIFDRKLKYNNEIYIRTGSSNKKISS